MPSDPPPGLLDPTCQPALPFPGLEVPGQFHWVLQSPAPLAGMSLPPRGTPWEPLHDLGFRQVVCLCSDRPVYDPAPLEWIVAVELCDLAEVPLPEDPDTEERDIRLISRAIQRKLAAGEGVIVHCAGGRGRTGTVIGCVLRGLGYSANEVVEFLDAVHKRRGKSGWPEADWQRLVVERSSESC
jgi:hypothetical protein